MYIASVLIGIGAAVLWAAQAEFLHLQSPTDQIMMRNTGIFWCLFQIRDMSTLFFTDKLLDRRRLLTPLKSHDRKSLHLSRMEWKK